MDTACAVRNGMIADSMGSCLQGSHDPHNSRMRVVVTWLQVDCDRIMRDGVWRRALSASMSSTALCVTGDGGEH